MLNEEILILRKKLNESITKEEDYAAIYQISIELDNLVMKYYNKKTKKNQKTVYNYNHNVLKSKQ